MTGHEDCAALVGRPAHRFHENLRLQRVQAAGGLVEDEIKEQRVAMIKYSIETARKFGVAKPKIALIHATEIANPKIRFMEDYLDIMEMYRNGEFGDVVMDGPIDIFLAIDKERGAIKRVDTPVLGDADILIFPDFDQ